MRINIGNTSDLILSGNKIKVVIRPSAISMTISSFLIFGLIFSLVVFLFADDIKDESYQVFFLAVFYPIYSFGYKEVSEIDLKERSLIKRELLLGMRFDKAIFYWEEDCYFSYEIVYDSYQNISSIWLLLRYNKSKGFKRLINFRETTSFFDFKKTFNKKFPDHKIMEWHD